MGILDSDANHHIFNRHTGNNKHTSIMSHTEPEHVVKELHKKPHRQFTRKDPTILSHISTGHIDYNITPSFWRGKDGKW